MQKHRIIVFATIALMVLTIVAGWFLVAQPQVAMADAARIQLTALNGQIATSQAAIAQLKKDEKNLPKLRKELLTLRSSIPKGLDSSNYITALNALATQSGVTITSIGVQDGLTYAPPAAAAPPAEGAAAATDAAAPTPAPAPAAPPSTLVTNPLITAENFVAIPITITATGGWTNVLDFVSGLQSGPRLILVSGLDTHFNADEAGTYTVDASGYIYAITTGATGYDLTGLSKNNNGGNRTHPAPTPTPTPTPEPTETAAPGDEETPTPTPTANP